MNEISTTMAFLSSFPFAKVVYSTILVAIVGVGTLELYRLWFDRTLEVQVFKYMEERTPKEESGTAFTWALLEKHAALRARFKQAEAEDIEAETVYRTKDDSPIRGTDSVLSELNITVSQFNVTAFLNYLRRWVSSPQELRGLVSSDKIGDRERFTVSADVRGGPKVLADGKPASASIRFSKLASVDDAVFQMACHLIWLSAASHQEQLAIVGRDEFCLWARYWNDFLDLKEDADRNGGLSSESAAALDTLITSASDQVKRPANYPRFRDLRADMYEFRAAWASDDQKARNDRVAAQRDHFDYLKSLNADKRDVFDISRMASDPNLNRILAAMRPALPVKTDGSIDYSSVEETDKLLLGGSYAHFWKNALDSADSVTSASKAMGLARIGKTQADANTMEPLRCFAIGDRLVVTAGISFDPSVFDINVVAPYWFDVPSTSTARFWFAKSAEEMKEPNQGIAIKRILVLGSGVSDLVLFEIEQHDTTRHPPIALDSSGTEADAAGEFIAVLGYPARDPKMPAALTEAILGKSFGNLRVMPGRSTSPAVPGSVATTLDQLRLTFEASTMAGTAGGPVIGLHSGKLVGISMAGDFDEKQMLKLGSAVRTSDIVGREPFKTALLSVANPLELAMPSLTVGVPIAIPGEEEAAALPDEHDSFAGRTGYDPGFLGSAIVPLPVGPLEVALTPLDYTHFSLGFDVSRRLAAFAAVNIDGSRLVNVPRDRAERFFLDVRVDADQQVDNSFYKMFRSIDRGTLLRRSYVAWGSPAEAETAVKDWYALPGVVPQHKDFNQKSWNDLERFVSDWITRNQARATVLAGPVFASDDPTVHGVTVPRAFWQILVVVGRDGSLQTAAFVLSQSVQLQAQDDLDIHADVPPFDLVASRTTVQEISKMTRLDFGTLIDAQSIE
ncbi:hypothetical protein HFO33_35365 [Rhizobium leguminosarum]|uniref:DNA/RNA non-specific endonuclease n=1 Tax=Rhizobium leguminosarum TaxID=384 RepID=UPI001C97FC77|nr:DNA/RNA non-specific endonuclease [Rhizobium leguminosarum]MBY5721773.1 hypothetical protein [Rhizobium leguminosarum]